MKNLLQKRWFYHSISWTLFFLLIWSSYQGTASNPEPVWEKLSRILPILVFMMISAYSSLFIHQRWFSKRNYVFFIGAFFILPALWSLIFTNLIFVLFGAELHSGFFQNYANFLVISSMAIGLRYLKRGTIDQYFLQEAKAQLLEHELNALKSQLNPHFLFNTLNNIYGTNLKNPEKGSEMILSLSELFRYQLESQKKDNVKLDDEIRFLNDYIELERLRLTSRNSINVNIELERPETLVAPMLFLPFIENAVKYGTYPSRNAVILIELKQNGKHISFRCDNPIFPDKQVVSTQTGLQNVKRRLEILYPGKHQLEILKTNSTYSVQLNLELV
jgi:sensor histidine kinase YesM